jgi:hypothetical protein
VRCFEKFEKLLQKFNEITKLDWGGGYQPPSFSVMSKKSIHFQGNVFIELFWLVAMTDWFTLNKYIFEDIVILLFSTRLHQFDILCNALV